MSCDVCEGTPGRYPIINKYGTQLYEIACPECCGSGLNDAELAEASGAHQMQMKYDAVMAENRAARTSE